MPGMPSKLKNMIGFHEGVSLQGEIAEFNFPKLAHKTEGWRGGGMDSEVEVALGLEGEPVEWTLGGMNRQVLKSFGITGVAGIQLRFAGAYQEDLTGAVDAYEVILRGFHKEMDPGGAKPGDDTELKITTSWSYYKLTCNGEVIHEIDKLNMIKIIDGVDVLAEQRRALGI